MAYNNSGELPIGQSYQLGDYVFSITVSHDPGESETGINVRCDKGGERARVASEVTGTVESWSVEANETEASVYVKVVSANAHLKSGAPSAVSGTVYVTLGGGYGRVYTCTETLEPVLAGYWEGNGWTTPVLIGPVSFGIKGKFSGDVSGQQVNQETAKINGVDFVLVRGGGVQRTGVATRGTFLGNFASNMDALNTLAKAYYNFDNSGKGNLIARFAIDIRDAGGGPGGDWDEPGDTGDPSYTLNVNVTGASAGTHDAAAVPMAPADQPVYGSGGAGGNGGGGGAGQSTTIVRRFATSRAGSVNQEVTLRPPGVGGKGGPGGKGGDGCILIFY